MDHIFTKKPGLPTLGDFDTKIKENIPEITDATHIVYSGKVKIKIYQDWVIQNRVAFVDSSFFKIFNFKIEKFDDFKNINTPNVALVSRSFYLNNFKKDSNIKPKIIEYDNHLIQIVGVFDINGMSHLNIDLLISKATLSDSNPFSNIGLTYIKSINGVSENNLLVKLNKYSKSIIPHIPDKLGIYLEKIEDVFFYTNENPYTPITNFRNRSQLQVISIVGFFILGVAFLNIFGLSYSEAVNKIKEMKIRKILGSNFYSILSTFFKETAVLFSLSIILSGTFIYFSIPLFNTLINAKVTVPMMISNRSLVIVALLFLLALTVRMSAYLIVNTKVSTSINVSDHKFHGMRLLNGLLIFEMAFTFVLFFSSFIIVQKNNSYKRLETGFNLNCSLLSNSNSVNELELIKMELENGYSIKSSICSGSPIDGLWYSKFDENDAFTYGELKVDENYFDVYSIKLIKGRYLLQGDSNRNVVVNRKFISTYSNMTHSIDINEEIELGGSKKTIVGIVDDLILDPTQVTDVVPICFSVFSHTDEFIERKLSVSTNSDIQNILASIARKANIVSPEVSSVQGLFESKFSQLLLTGRLTKFGTAIATTLLIVGMIAFLSFAIEKRSKEIGIRKVIGATIYDILRLFIIRISLLYLFGMALSTPFIMYFINSTTDIKSINLFDPSIVLPFGIFFIICILTVFIYAHKMNSLNPVITLKKE